jgi:UDP-N-acetylglucosamine diphosphorylase/glucosamine-1-phosphate N-acetyltransferase
MNYILFDDNSWHNLLPLTYTRPVAEIRIGILTIKEKWEIFLNKKISFQTQDYLSKQFKKIIEDDNIYINGKIIPNQNLVLLINALENNQAIKCNNTLIAYRTDKQSEFDFNQLLISAKEVNLNFLSINNVWDIFCFNGDAISQDFELITKGKKSKELSPSNKVIGKASDIFIEEGAVVEAAILNTKSGPIYIGKNTEVMEGSIVRGPFALCEQSVLKLAAKIYGPTTIGPHSKVGGEINNSVIFGFSNKAHDGFLGNSVIGQWCNLGADTNNSNLKNNYANVKLFNYKQDTMVDTGLQFCGLIMGDHSKCGINTMFNTGTVVGVGANIFGGGFPPTHIPSYSWGGSEGMQEYKFEKMIETANRVYERRNLSVSKGEHEVLKFIFDNTSKYRKG